MSRYLVTGGTGFLGSHLVAHLRERGHEVVALCRSDAPELAALGAVIAKGDVLDSASIDSAAKGCDGLFHCAGLVSRDPADAAKMMAVHQSGTRITLQAARVAGVRRAVVASTSGTVAVGTEPKPLSEDAPTPNGLISRWPYYRSKLFAEQEAFRHNKPGFEVTCVNPCLLLGPGDIRGSSTEDVRHFLERKVQAVPAGGLCFVDVRDVAVALQSAMERGRPGERYLLGACNCTLREFFGKLERLSGVKAPWLPMPKSPELAVQAVRFMDRVVERFGGKQPVTPETIDLAQHFWFVNWSKAERELGFKPRDPLVTLHDTIQDLRDRGVVWPVLRRASGT